jgi:hypothetical protein
MLRINSADSDGSQRKLAYFVYFAWPPLEVGQQISTFFSCLQVVGIFHICCFLRYADLRKLLIIVKDSYVHFVTSTKLKVL